LGEVSSEKYEYLWGGEAGHRMAYSQIGLAEFYIKTME